jgi:hypothetical protein
MKLFFRYPNILLLSIASLALQAKAASDHGHKQHEAHLHGSAELTLAIEADSLEISLESPAANIVGFEHRATSPEQVNAATKAQAALNSAERLFSFTGSSCSLQKASIDMSAIIEPDQAHDTHEKHHAGDGDHEHHDDEEGSHSEISAVYHYQCKSGADISGITVNLHDYFPAIENLKIMWLTDSGQGAVELTGEANFVRLR